jgi:hypothetical protein
MTRPLGVDEVVLEEHAHQPPVREVACEAEADDAQLLAAHRRQRDRVLLLARHAAGTPRQSFPERPHLRAPRFPAAGPDLRLRPRLEPQRVELHIPHSGLGERLLYLPGPAVEEALRAHGSGGLEGLLPRRLLEVLLGVAQELLCLLQQADLQVLGLLGDRVEGQDAEGDRGQQHGPHEDPHDAPARVGDPGEAPLDVGHFPGDCTTAAPTPSDRLSQVYG